MVYQPPTGARDLLPVDVAQKHWIEERLRTVFRRWGYHRIITSTLERLETLIAGGAVQPSSVIQLQDNDEVLGLRPELTASIARAVVTRMAGATFPQRLYYNANVFRRASEGIHGGQQEFFQTGVELLGADGLMADAEILLLLSDCLQQLGVGEWRLLLAEAGLTRSLLAQFPPPLQPKVRHAIAHLDRLTLEALPLSPELRSQALFLFDLRGEPEDVLTRLSGLLLNAEQEKIVHHLKSLVELLKATAPDLPLTLDLSLLHTFDYYTGLVFQVVTEQGSSVLGQGGRYNNLLGLYHPQGEHIPGIGFCLNIDELHGRLLPTGILPQETVPCDWLVVGMDAAPSAIFAYAQQLRASEKLVRVEVDFGRSAQEVRDYAKKRRIKYIAWIVAEAEPKIEAVNEG